MARKPNCGKQVARNMSLLVFAWPGLCHMPLAPLGIQARDRARGVQEYINAQSWKRTRLGVWGRVSVIGSASSSLSSLRVMIRRALHDSGSGLVLYEVGKPPCSCGKNSILSQTYILIWGQPRGRKREDFIRFSCKNRYREHWGGQNYKKTYIFDPMIHFPSLSINGHLCSRSTGRIRRHVGVGIDLAFGIFVRVIEKMRL